MVASVGFVGLGSMGRAVAGRLSSRLRSISPKTTMHVFDVNASAVVDFVTTSETIAVGHETSTSVIENADLTFICVPTTSVSKEIIGQVGSAGAGNVIVDLTSGAPSEVAEVSDLAAGKGLKYIESPLSGGPMGAAAGTLTTFVAGDTGTYGAALPFISAFSSNRYHLSEKAGAGSATKSVNNVLNCMNLLASSEGLLSLAKFGVKPEDAVAAINNSSGRSLQTQVRIPTEVLSGNYSYGFSLKLMSKDVGIGTKFVDGDLIGKKFDDVVKGLEQAVGGEEDYTSAVKGLRLGGGELLQSGFTRAESNASKDTGIAEAEKLLLGSSPLERVDQEAFMPADIKLLVCDMAGTTVDEGGIVYETLFNVLTEAGVNLEFQEVDAWHGAEKLKVIEHFVNRHEFAGSADLDDRKFRSRCDALHDNFVEAIKRAYFDDESKISLISPGLPEHFNGFREKGVKIGLNTGYPVEIQDAIIKKLGMADFVDTWVSAQNWGGRPKAHMIHACMRNMGVDDVRHVAKAGDTLLDIQEGIQAGVGFNIGLLSGADGVKTLRRQGADVVLPNLMTLHIV